MARKASEWQELLRQYAQAYADTGVKPQEWYETNISPDGWSSAKRHISSMKAKKLIESGEIKAKKSHKSTAKKTTKKASSSAKKTTARKKASKSQSEPKKNSKKEPKSTSSKSLNNKEKTENLNQEGAQKNSCVNSSSSEKNTAISKQPHDAHCQDGEKEGEKSHLLCGRINRLGEPCQLRAGFGTGHVGEGACKFHGGAGGAPKKNSNATVHGVYSQFLDEDEVALFNSDEAKSHDLKNEIALTRVELKRCYEKAAIQRKILDGPEGYFGMPVPLEVAEKIKDENEREAMQEKISRRNARYRSAMELKAREVGVNVGADVDMDKAVLVDYTEIANRLMGRLMSLIRQQNQLENTSPARETDEVLVHYITGYQKGALTALEVAAGLAMFKVKTPEFILLALRNELENQKPTEAGLTPEELDAIVKEERNKQEAIFEENMEGRDELIAMMEAGEDIPPEFLESLARGSS